MIELTELYRILILALIQGITEFLPISSSAHLILVPHLFDWEDPGLANDVVMHFGTLLAVIIYYRAEIAQLFGAGATSYLDDGANAMPSLLKIAVASLPVLLLGYILAPLVENELRSVELIAYTTMGFSLMFLLAHYWPSHTNKISWSDACVIGLAQAIALVPGVSRMGVALAAALLLGVNRIVAAKFVFMLAIPVIFFANVYTLGKLSFDGGLTVGDWLAFVIGFVVAFVVALATIHLFMKVLERVGLIPFVVYRILLGAVLLIFIV